jgi:hypothetical protein
MAALKARDVWAKARTVISAVGVFGLNSFALLLLRNQADRSLVFLICTITAIYIALLIAQYRITGIDPSRRERLARRTRFVFRWIYVAVYLTIISANLYHADWHGEDGVLSGKIVYQLVMVVFIALTVPRDMLWQKVKPVMLAKWRAWKLKFTFSSHGEDKMQPSTKRKE